MKSRRKVKKEFWKWAGKRLTPAECVEYRKQLLRGYPKRALGTVYPLDEYNRVNIMITGNTAAIRVFNKPGVCAWVTAPSFICDRKHLYRFFGKDMTKFSLEAVKKLHRHHSRGLPCSKVFYEIFLRKKKSAIQS